MSKFFVDTTISIFHTQYVIKLSNLSSNGVNRLVERLIYPSMWQMLCVPFTWQGCNGISPMPGTTSSQLWSENPRPLLHPHLPQHCPVVFSMVFQCPFSSSRLVVDKFIIEIELALTIFVHWEGIYHRDCIVSINYAQCARKWTKRKHIIIQCI